MKRVVSMKIISGILKGRKIAGYDIKGTRPTMDRVKESLFAMINPYLDNSICLDLFAGSGNLGFEALSNGSRFCYFNDINRKCIDVIKKNSDDFKMDDKVKILNLDYEECLRYLKDHDLKMDIIFLDPPFKKECLNMVIDKILEYDLLNDGGVIVCEIDNNYLNSTLKTLEIIKERKYGLCYMAF